MFKLEMKTKSVDHWIGENVFHIAELFSCVRGAPTLAMQGPGPAYYQVVWLASFSDGKRTATDCRVRHKWLNKEAETERHVRQTLADFDAGKSYNHFPGHQICGLALLSPRSCHHALLPLDEQMQSQHNMWSMLNGSPMDGNLYYFQVLQCDSTLYGVPLDDTRTGRTTCFFHLDHAWAQRSFTTDILGITQARLNRLKFHTGGVAPTLTLRLPKAVAFLVISHKWSTVAVPDSLQQINLMAGWDSRHVRKRDVRNELRQLKQALDESVSFPMVHALANADPQPFDVVSQCGKAEMQRLLQETALFLVQGRPMTDEARCDLHVKLLSAAQALQKAEISVNIFRQDGNFLHKARKFSAIRLLEYFWVSGALSNDRDLRETLKQACLVSMPTEEGKHAAAFIEGGGHERLRVPSASTISRVRGRLDTAWMLYFREHVVTPKLKCCGGSGVRVFVQTDATWQARQEYQVTVLNLVDHAHLLQLHKD